MHRQGNRSDRRFCNFTSAMTALNRQIKGELSDTELDSIAGGASAGEIVGYVSIGLIPAAIAANRIVACCSVCERSCIARDF